MDIWYPKATRRPGPPQKQYAQPNTVRGAVLHSMVGSMAGALAELDRASRQASWHFSIAKSGQVLQHYPIHVATWHCGSPTWNQRLIGIEHEGGPIGNESEPLTSAQLEASVALVRWIAEQGGWTPSRSGQRTLHEHNEVSPTPTACPSNRIPWSAYLAQPVSPQSPPLTLDEAFLAVADAYIPAYDTGYDTSLRPLPRRDGADVYELTRRRR